MMGHKLASLIGVGDRVRPQLGRLVVTPLATIGVLAAVLVWEIEHVGSVTLAATLTLAGVAVGVMVARRVRGRIEELASYYERLLLVADEQSRREEAANRVKDAFLATLSHELRTPLNAVLGWTRLLASGKLDEHQTARAIESIERAGWAQSRLIEDLLDISHIVNGNMELRLAPVRLRSLVESAVQSLRAAADAKRIALTLLVDPTLEPTMADPDRLRQVVWNLVSNAIKFTPTDGRVTVQLARDRDDVVLRVNDSGIGFGQDVAAHLFERFRQGDASSTRKFGGIGLGLGIVRHIIELHGGTVTASSAGADSGSTFEARWPFKTVPASAGQNAPTTVRDPLLSGVSVLVVDDEPQTLDFVKTTLERHGANVVTAGSAREATDRFRSERPDVLVSDVLMPGRDGIDLIREIRRFEGKRGSHTPAAALSALARAEDKRRSLNAGYEIHVAKPVDPDELAFAVAGLAHVGDRPITRH